MNKLALSIVAVFLFILFIFSFFVFEGVDAGNAGVKYNHWTGEVNQTPISQGKFKWVGFNQSIYEYPIRIVKTDANMDLLSKNGMSINLHVTLRYSIMADSLPMIFQTVAKNPTELRDKVVTPDLESITREVIGMYTDEQIYKDTRNSVQIQIKKRIQKTLRPKGILVEALLFKDVELPASQMKAIEEKQKANQELQKTEYALKIAEKEAEKKIIEANGQAESMRIIQQSITPQAIEYERLLVQREQLKAQKEIAKTIAESKNAKIIMSGNGDQPFIVNPN